MILGHGPIAQQLASKIDSHPEIPLRVVGFLFPGKSETDNGFVGSLEQPFTSVKTLQILELLAKQQVQKLIIAMPQSDGAEVRKLIAECRKAFVQVYVVPQLYDPYLSKAELLEIDGLPLLSLQERRAPGGSLALKPAMDFALSLGIPGSWSRPFWHWLPWLFTAKRVGRSGRSFVAAKMELLSRCTG